MKPRVLFVLMLAVAAVGAAFGFTYVKTGFTVGWKTSQYFFSWQTLGFVSRGLPATLLYPLRDHLTGPALLAFHGLVVVLCAAAWVALYARAARRLSPADATTLAAVSLLAPSTFLRLGYDYGRFDALELLLTFLILGMLGRGRDAAAGVTAAVAVLIHEGFLLLHLPVIAALALTTGGAGRALRVVIPAVLAGLALALAGRYEPGLDDLAARFAADPAYLAASPHGAVDRDALAVLTRDVDENLRFNATFFTERRPYGHLALIGLWFAVFARFYTRFFTRNRLPRGVVYGSAFAPLLMCVYACDYFRWFAISTVDMLVVMMCMLERAEGEPTLPLDTEARLICASAVLGPISNTKSFPCLFLVLEAVSPWTIRW